ncbi:MAG: mitochondrial fission ELM1 family protein [Beijerinckiaceae bacterium]
MTYSFSTPQLDEARQRVAGATCWIVTDGKAGDENQCLGVAELLRLSPDLRRVKPRAPFAWIMPRGPIDPAEASDKPDSPIAPPFPDLAIASGRRAVAYLRAIKTASRGRTVTVFLKDPRTGTSAADLIWVPSHDRLRGQNVVVTLTSPHRISAERLEEARRATPGWLNRNGLYGKRPVIGVLLGGDSRHHRFSEEDIAALTEQLSALADSGGQLAVTPSRRTPPALSRAIQALCARHDGFFWSTEGDNPYLAILAHADHLIVTADSVNMLGEAAATGKPIHLFTPGGGHTKISAFVNGLIDHGAVRPLISRLENWTYPPLDATQTIAVAIAKTFAEKSL